MPEWLWLLLLTLASFRVWRLLAEDTILDRPRNKLLRLSAGWREEQASLTRAGREYVPPAEYRAGWATWLTCPWCLGFWIVGLAVTLWAIEQGWPGLYLFITVWLALSAGVGLLAKLDKEE